MIKSGGDKENGPWLDYKMPVLMLMMIKSRKHSLKKKSLKRVITPVDKSSTAQI